MDERIFALIINEDMENIILFTSENQAEAEQRVEDDLEEFLLNEINTLSDDDQKLSFIIDCLFGDLKIAVKDITDLVDLFV